MEEEATYRVLCPSTKNTDGSTYVVGEGKTLERAQRLVEMLAEDGAVCPGPHTIEKEE